MLGYWGDEERTRERMRRIEGADYFLTGDLARIDEEGYFFYQGRFDDVINSSGYRIGPTEIESVLLEYPGIEECAVVASPDADRGEVVKAFIVLDKNSPPDAERAHAIQEFVKAMTAPYKYPRKIEFVETLPMTPTGKIQRRILRDQEFAKQESAK